MGFGSEEFFIYLKTEVTNSDGDGTIYYILDQEIKKIAYPIIKNKIPYEYVDDVYQEVFFSVWRNISAFIINMEEKTEGQRVAWLLTIIKRRIADYYVKVNKEQSNKVYLEDVGDKLSLEEEAREIDKDEFTSCMSQTLFELFSIATSPEKILSFVYSKIILSGESGSGKPSITSEYLRGHTLFDILEMMKRDLEAYLEVQIPESVFIPLSEKLNKIEEGHLVGNKEYRLSTKTIVDGTNRIQRKMESKRDRW